MIKHHIMNNRRHVLTKDSSGAVELWDITQVTFPFHTKMSTSLIFCLKIFFKLICWYRESNLNRLVLLILKTK
jgi:hypothetical protein